MSEQLPVCVLCGEPPRFHGLLVQCGTHSCGARGAMMNVSDWRRLMARPRLAPGHVGALRHASVVLDVDGHTETAKEVRAAIAALGEVPNE